MTYRKLESFLKKCNCRIEKTTDDENGNKSISIYASTVKASKTKRDGDEIKIMRVATDKEKSFDELSSAIHDMIFKSGIRLTLMALAEKMDNEEQSSIIGADGKPLKKENYIQGTDKQTFDPNALGSYNSPK